MIRYFKACILLLATLITFSIDSKASHVAGVDITWECIGGNQFEVFLSIYRDCDGINISTTGTQLVDFTNTCGYPNQQVNFTYVQPTGPVTPNGGINIAQLCQPDSLLSTCFNGTLPGMEKYVFSGIVTLNPQCDYWTAYWDICCRNNAIVNLQGPATASMYAEANIYTVSDACDNSPIFSAQPIPYVCVNQPVFYNYGVIDPDGDSLVYSLIPARETVTTLIPYTTGYSSLAPLPGLTLNSNTGELAFTPTLIGNFVIVVLVKEYDAATGTLIGEVMRDMQFTVITCTNTNPTNPVTATNVSGTASVTGPFAFDMCVGTNVSFDLVFTDADPSDTLTLSSNVQTVLNGATFTTTGVNPITAHISWTAVGNTASILAFTVEVKDDACPIAGISTQTVVISIVPSVYAGQDMLICDGIGVNLTASGGTNFQWSVISGPPIVVGNNFSCDTCATVFAEPASTTTYLVTSNLNTLCVNQDTIVVNVTPPFGFNSVQVIDATCNGADDGQIVLTPFGAAGPPWNWMLFNSGGIAVDSASTTGAQTFSGIEPGTYSITLSEPAGCSHDTLGLVIGEPAAMTITAGDTLICLTSVASVGAQAAGGNGTFSYTWNNGLVGNGPHAVSPANSTYYTVFATDQLGCTSPLDSFFVDMHPPLTLNPTWTDSICIGEPATLNGGGSGGNGGPYTYSWVQVGSGSLGTGNTISTTPGVGATDFVVTMTDNCGTPAVSMTLPVVWYAAPQPLLSPDVFEDCFPAAITFSNDTDPAFVGNTCVWDFGDGNVVSGGCGSITHVFQNVGCYDVGLTVYSPAGCSGDTTYSQLVCARPYPQADYSFGPQPTNVFNTTLYFINESVNGVSYDWQFGIDGDLGSSTATNPVWVFPDTDQATYPVWLYATNIYGCVDSIMYLIEIDGEYAFWVPNAFTPDGDANNNSFGVMGEGISAEEFTMQIFDRWGELIWESNDPNIWWDGSEAIQGVYAYRIEATNRYSRIKKEYLGHVTLLR